MNLSMPAEITTKKKLALLVNQISPYRVPVYKGLAARFELMILHGGMESNRSWKAVEIAGARSHRVWGWQLCLNRRQDAKLFDTRFLHVEPGYITALWRERPDAVITSELGFRTLVALAYGALFRKPVWIWWGGTLHTERRIGRLRRMIRHAIAHSARHWISYGQTSTDYLHSLGVAAEDVVQIQNCVDESWFLQSAEPALEIQPKPVLLHVGRITALKGISGFLRAAARLQGEGLQFSILVVGSGPEEEELRSLVKEFVLRNVQFHPTQPAEAMPRFYRSADVLVFPTLEDVWGLVANEAVLSGLPVLCSRFAGCATELFPPECIFDPSDDENFSSALRNAINGQLPQADRSRLKSSNEVAEIIADGILTSLIPRNCSGQKSGAGTALPAGEFTTPSGYSKTD